MSTTVAQATNMVKTEAANVRYMFSKIKIQAKITRRFLADAD